MTQGELHFYLREVHPYWTTPHISEEKIAELEAAQMIERGTEPVCVIRLTKEGMKVKTAARHLHTGSQLNLTNPVRRRHFKRPEHKKPRPWS